MNKKQILTIVLFFAVVISWIVFGYRHVHVAWDRVPSAQAYRVDYWTAPVNSNTRLHSITVPTNETWLWVKRWRTNMIRVTSIDAQGQRSAPSSNLVVKP